MNNNMKSLRSVALLLAVGAFPAFLNSQVTSNSLNVGVAQLSGEIQLVASDPAESVADITLASADTGTVKVNLAFKSTQTVAKNDEVDVIGDLTLTILERNATYNPTEDYAGPAYGEGVVHNVTRQVVFVIPKGNLAQRKAKNGISASAAIGRENFPELIPAIYAATWPPVVEDEHCRVPSAGEDYRGPLCTGNVLETENAISPPVNTGEDYRGFEIVAPAGNVVKIALNLPLTGEGSLGTASFFIG